VPLSVSRVAPVNLDFVWREVAPMVERGLRHGAGDSTSPAELRAAIATGKMELWAVADGGDIVAIVVLRVVSRVKGVALLVSLVAGRDFDSWGQMISDLVADYAELIGAYTVEATARKGMAKWLAQMGWRQKAIVMELDNGRF